MAQERSYLCRDPSLRFPEEILLHRYICQANTGSPPDAVCQGQEFRTDNLPLQPSWSAQRWAEVKLLRSPVAAYQWAERVRWGLTVVAGAGILGFGWEDNSPSDGEAVVAAALRRMRRARMPRGEQATLEIS